MTEEYADKYPKDLRLAITSMVSDESFGILILLIKEDGLKYEKIRDELDIDTEELDNKLSKLQTGGLVEKRVGERIGDKTTGEYEISNFGYRLLNCIAISKNPNVSDDDINELLNK